MLLQIDESIGDTAVSVPGTPSISTISLDGHEVTRTASTTGNAMVFFTWRDQGTTFMLTVRMADPDVTEQDIEKLIASMLDSNGQPQRTYTYPSPTATDSPVALPLNQEANVWSQVAQAVDGGIDPILKPGQLPDGLQAIRLVTAYPPDSANSNPATFAVEYTGPGKQLDISVGQLNLSECAAGCTQSQITIRGQRATLQVNGPNGDPPNFVWLWWSEPGTWRGASGHPPGIEYWVFAHGLSAAEVQQIAASMIQQISPTATATPPSSGSSATPLVPLLTPSAKLPTKEAATQWAIDYASPSGGPTATVLQANLTTFADVVNQHGSDLGWTEAAPRSAEQSTPVWVVEVRGANVGFVCPPGFKECDLTHVNLVFNAETGAFVAMYLPPSSFGTPTS